MSEILKKQLSDAEAAGRRIAKQLFEVEKERDALAAKLAELEGQEPMGWIYRHQETAKVQIIDAQQVESGFENNNPRWLKYVPFYARPIPTESRPVNARLLEAIKRLSFCAQTTGGTAGRDEELCAAIGEAEKAIAAAESAPKAVRLTDEEVASLLADSDKNSLRVPSFFMVEPHKFARAIESAVLRKNGIEVAE